MTAPIVLFVFARPEHTRRTLEALKANVMAPESDLIVYADGARQPAQEARVREVREIVRATSGFRSVKLVERDTNVGLARNIVEGVTRACDEHGRVIVLEDDIVTSPQFLTFMNGALDHFAGEPRVWHVCGWNYPVDAAGLGDAFLWRVMNCWGWGTWKDRWQHFSKDPARLVTTWSRDQIKRFNLDGAHEFWAQVTANHRGKINTWAIFWYASIFERGGLCLNPAQTLAQNIGQDGSGDNCPDDVLYWSELQSKSAFTWPATLEENALAVSRVQRFYRDSIPTPYQRVVGRLKRLVSRRR
jgi:hypothetical protein